MRVTSALAIIAVIGAVIDAVIDAVIGIHSSRRS
jgi:hypothetical protein